MKIVLVETLVSRNIKRGRNVLFDLFLLELTLHPVTNTAECESLMDQGWKNRSVGATEMNADSSRSHSIFTISIEMMSTGKSLISYVKKSCRIPR